MEAKMEVQPSASREVRSLEQLFIDKEVKFFGGIDFQTFRRGLETFKPLSSTVEESVWSDDYLRQMGDYQRPLFDQNKFLKYIKEFVNLLSQTRRDSRFKLLNFQDIGLTFF